MNSYSTYHNKSNFCLCYQKYHVITLLMILTMMSTPRSAEGGLGRPLLDAGEVTPVTAALAPDKQASDGLVTHGAPGGGHPAPVTPPGGPGQAPAALGAALVHRGALLVLGVNTRQPALAQNLNKGCHPLTSKYFM